MNKLVIGNKNYSTWSFRAWWVLKHAGIDFEEVMVPLYVEGYRDRLLAFTPSAKVPIYFEDELAIWDSLAICEYVAETHASLWPQDAAARARARSLSAEMHSGFFAIRGALHMNCRAEYRAVAVTAEIVEEVRRVEALVSDCRNTYGQNGPWLFGNFSIADAMFAPIIFSLRTYGIDSHPAISEYAETLSRDPYVRAWFAAAREEQETIAICEVGENTASN